MADTAAHLVDRVLPLVPIRQWVLSFPVSLRYRLAYDSRLVRDVLGIFIRAVFASLRRRARAYAGIRKAQSGAVTFVQRFGGSVNLNLHFHSLVRDGVCYLDDRERLRFRRLPPYHPRNYSWAELLKRVWEVDVLECPRCGGRMRILAAIHSADAIRSILECLGLLSRAPPISPALEDEVNFPSNQAYPFE